MDNEAIKAYSGVIADAAEDSEPEHPVQYTAMGADVNQATRAEHAPANWFKLIEYTICKCCHLYWGLNMLTNTP